MSVEQKHPMYLTAAEVIDRFRGTVSAKTLANWRARKQGPPFFKSGKRVLYPVADLLEWELARTTECSDRGPQRGRAS